MGFNTKIVPSMLTKKYKPVPRRLWQHCRARNSLRILENIILRIISITTTLRTRRPACQGGKASEIVYDVFFGSDFYDGCISTIICPGAAARRSAASVCNAFFEGAKNVVD